MMDKVYEGDDSYCKSLLLIRIVNGSPELDKYYVSWGCHGDRMQSNFLWLTAAL